MDCTYCKHGPGLKEEDKCMDCTYCKHGPGLKEEDKCNEFDKQKNANIA